MTTPPSLPTVAVSASAQLEVPPDTFVIQASATGSGGNSTDSMQDLVARYAQLEGLAANLPDTVEVRHGELTNWPEGGRRRLWHARRVMTLIGRDPSAVAEVASALAAIPEVALEGPTWQIDRDNRAYGELQSDAVDEARARAERYAAAVGGTLGPLIELSDPEGAHVFRDSARAFSLSAAAAPDVGSLDLSPQTVTITATVNARWYVLLPD
jgi:uncharacterized protein YggE